MVHSYDFILWEDETLVNHPSIDPHHCHLEGDNNNIIWTKKFLGMFFTILLCIFTGKWECRYGTWYSIDRASLHLSWLLLWKSRVADPHHFNTNPDPVFTLMRIWICIKVMRIHNSPFSHWCIILSQMQKPFMKKWSCSSTKRYGKNLWPLVDRPSRAPFWASSMRIRIQIQLFSLMQNKKNADPSGSGSATLWKRMNKGNPYGPGEPC